MNIGIVGGPQGIVVHSKEDIEYANGMMIAGLVFENKLCGTTCTIEDGKITAIHTKRKTIVE